MPKPSQTKPLTDKKPEGASAKPGTVDEVIDKKIAEQVKDAQPEQGEDKPLSAAEKKAEERDAAHLSAPPPAPENPAIPVSADEAYKAMEGDQPKPSLQYAATPEPIHELTQQIEDEEAGEVDYVATLEQAQALQEADDKVKGKPAGKGAAFEFFKSRDGRTMRVIYVGGRHLAAQEVK
jgi:FtsZ-interacting cell division protein ZipA